MTPRPPAGQSLPGLVTAYPGQSDRLRLYGSQRNFRQLSLQELVGLRISRRALKQDKLNRYRLHWLFHYPLSPMRLPETLRHSAGFGIAAGLIPPQSALLKTVVDSVVHSIGWDSDPTCIVPTK